MAMTVFRTLRRRVRLAALLFGSMLSLAAFADDSIDRHLARAEAVKRTQLSAFVAELEAVEAELPLLSPRQREHLQYLRAWQQAYSGNFDAAIEGFQALIDSGSDALLRFRSRVTMLNALTLTRRYTESYEQLNLILEQLAEVDDADARAQALGATAQLLNQVAQFDESLSYSKRLLQEGKSEWARCGAAQLRFESLVKSGKMTDVNAELLRQADECADRGEHVFAGIMRTYIAQLQMHNGRDGEAIAGLLRHQTSIRETYYPYLIADAAAQLAKAYLAQGNHLQAEAAAREAIDSTAPGANTEALAEGWRVIYLIAVRQGDHQRALRALEQYQKVDRAWLDDVGQRALAFEMARHQARAKALEIEGLNQQNQVLQLQQQVSQQNAKAARLSILLLLTVLAFALLWTLRTRRMNRHFREIAERDALTGVSSRPHFMTQAAAALEQLQRTNEPAVAVLMDLDQFKQINDHYGHAVGDDVLRRAALACRQLLGSSDLIGRLGGEEFAILLPRQSTAMANAWAERCRATLRDIRFGPEAESNLLSGSFGIASTETCGHDLERLLADSDAAMYAAKRQGRDRVVVHSQTEGAE
jgi:diguanylate cyclase (GGDEF)-like protein